MTQGGSGEKEKSQRALLVDGEKCCKPTDLFLKSSAASASTSANTVSTSTPGRKTGQWGIWARGGWRGRHGWLRDGKTRLYYGAAGSDDLLMCFMYWGVVVHSLGIYVYYHRGYQKCLFFTCVKNCACAHSPSFHGPLVGANARAIFCSQSVTVSGTWFYHLISSVLHRYFLWLSTPTNERGIQEQLTVLPSNIKPSRPWG